MKLHAFLTTRWVIAFVASALVAPALSYGNVGIFFENRTLNDGIMSVAPDPVVSATTNLSTDHNHTCAVTATAATSHLGNSGGEYFFDLTRGGIASASSLRQLSIRDVGDTRTHRTVATSATFRFVRGQTTITFRAWKNGQLDDNITVNQANISVNCQHPI